MKIKIIVLIILALAFLGGGIHFEKKIGRLAAEFEKIKSEHSDIISKQTKIEELKEKRAEYFEKVFLINRPGDISRSLTALINVLILMNDRSLRFSEINIISKTGAIEFEVKGLARKETCILDLMDKLESSAGAFIISKKTGEKNRRQFIIRGEVAAE